MPMCKEGQGFEPRRTSCTLRRRTRSPDAADGHFSASTSLPPVFIIKPDNIILFKIFPILDLNDLKGYLAGIFQPVPRLHGDVCALIGIHKEYLFPPPDSGRA